MQATSRSEYSTNGAVTLTKFRVTWGAVFAGVVIALALEALLNLLGLGLGLSAFTPDVDTLAALGIGSVIWLVVTGIVSMLIGGWVAGKLAGIEGTMHGLVSWGLTTLLIFIFMATTAGAIISGTASMLARGVSLAGHAAIGVNVGISKVPPQIADTAQTILPSSALTQLKQQANQILPQNLDDNAKTQLAQAITSFANAKNASETAAARQKLVSFLTQNTNMDRAQAERTVNDWQRNYQAMKAQADQKTQQFKQTAQDVTEKTSSALSAIALAIFFAFLLSAIAGALGGWLGVRSSIRSNRKV